MPPAPQLPADMVELKNKTTDTVLVSSHFHYNNHFHFVMKQLQQTLLPWMLLAFER